jgi:hypothetical protein
MKRDNPFDKKMALPQVQRMTSVVNTVPFVVDTLELAWAGVQSVFDDQAKPEHALMLLPTLLQRIDAERQLLRAEARLQMEGETPAPAAPRPARNRSGR